MALLRDLNARLDRTVIEQLPYEECVRHYDRPDTFFFLDPPYLNANPGVYEGWTLEQMQSLGQLLPEIKGPWRLPGEPTRWGESSALRGPRSSWEASLPL